MEKIVLNKNAKLRNGGRKTTNPTADDLLSHLKRLIEETDEDKLYDTSDLEHFDWGNFLCDYEVLDYWKMFDDIAKVNFSLENIKCTGLEVLENGLAVLKFQAGGDWEVPVFFVVYYDGKKIRGYVPLKGNTYNPKTKSALGNGILPSFNDNKGRDLDKEFVEKEGYKEGTDFLGKDYLNLVKPDETLCLQDVQARIQIV